MYFKITRISINDNVVPPELRRLRNPPSWIYYSGSLRTEDFKGIAVVGSRKMTDYGREVVKSVVGEVVNSGFTVISGLAFGVDIAAQELALDLGGRTLAVLASGIQNISPRSHFFTAQRIIESGQGAVISIYRPDAPAVKSNFIQRDYVMAAISKAVLVIEAAEISGTSHTVEAALDLGHEVFAVPGSIFSEYSRGCHSNIRNGAHITTSAQDIFDVLGVDYLKTKKEELARKSEKVFQNGLCKKLLSIIELENADLDTLSRKSAEPVGKILGAVSLLEIEGFIKNVNGVYIKG
ncbi:DNA-protecting protein DprA [candidate division WWE3 bacterium]|nr:DNA-protecting protein DprA [candidate division WWE3 bacterium]